MQTAIYPGSFDPITNGHVDLIRRGSRLFDKLVIAIAINAGKQPLFEKGVRVEMVRDSIKDLDNVEVLAYDGLVVELCNSMGAQVILRGIRTVTDFEYEFQIALTNRSFRPEIETVFVMPAEECSFISSSLVKEAVSLGGDVSRFVPELVNKMLKKKFNK